MTLASLALGTVALLGAHAAVASDAPGALQQRIDQLDTSVRAEEAVRSVKRLQNAYSHYLDSGSWSDLADLFTDDAVGEFGSVKVTGKAALRKHLMRQAERTSAGLAAGQLNVHLILQPIITLAADGRSAKGAWHELAMLGKFGTSATWAGGIYENEYASDHGVWKISRVHFYPQYSGGFDEFGHKAPARWDIPYHFEAAHVGVTIPQSLLHSTASTPANASSRASLHDLAQRVQRLDDESRVRNLQHSYGYYIDRKMWDDAADLFTDQGSLEVAQRGVYVGKPHIRRAFEVFYGAGPLHTGELFDHIQLATLVTIAADGRSAAARTTQLSMLGQNGEYARWEEGTYENEFVNEAGTWKLKAVHYYPHLTTEYDLGWQRDAQPAPGVSSEFPPDRPPTQKFASYPKAQYVGFHFVNPVTGKASRFGSGAVVRVKAVAPAPASGGSGGSDGTEAEAEALLADTERKLDRAIGVDAVENLNSSYGYYIDESAWDLMADTYGSKGTKELTGVGVYVGPDRIRKALNLRGPRGGRTPNFYTIHQLTQPVIDIAEDGNSAKGRFRLFQAGGAADGTSASWIGGIYENTAMKENGEWKFGRQELYHIFNASYKNGWARVGGVTKLKSSAGQPSPREERGGGITQGLGGAASPARFSTEFPPDYPIRVKQYAFPEIIEPPFHYRNPVTGRMPPELLP